MLQLFQLWSTPQVDLFSSHLNHHLPPLILSDQPPVGTNHVQGCHLCFPSIPLLERTLVNRENQPDEVIVKLDNITPSDGMRDPLLLTSRRDLLSAHPSTPT